MKAFRHHDQPPNEFVLFQNYPIRFNPATAISYILKTSAAVTLKIYNLLGQLVKTLVNEKQHVGMKTFQWHGTDEFGGKAAGESIHIGWRSSLQTARGPAFVKSKKRVLLR